MDILYKNIKLRRESLGLSQEELAIKVGYTSRSSIAKIENGDVDIPRSKIIAFAEALDCSPVELMGLIDIQEETPANGDTQLIITDTQERGLVTTYRALSPSGKEKLLSSAKDISILDQYKQEMQHYGSIAADTGGPGRLVRIPDETFNKNKKE